MSQPADKTAKKSPTNEWLETIIVVVEALLIAIVLRSFLYQPFSIPTASMQQTLMIGDYFVANKYVWGYGKHSFSLGRYGDFTALDFELPISNRILGRDPNRGDIAVFRPVPQNIEYIKRIVGLPGDRIQMQQGRLYINGTMVEREEIGKAQDTDSEGDTREVTVYRETFPEGTTHTIQEISDNAGLDNTQEYVEPAGHYFMMGDSRDRSADSRALSQVGYVPAVNLIAKAEARFFSIKDNLPPWQIWQWPANARWDRMFQSVGNERRDKNHDKLQFRLGYRFADPDLLDRALTYSSSVSLAKRIERSYQRLEFLGDRVLGLVVADMLYRRYPKANEGELSRTLNTLVRKETCAIIARQLDLGSEMNLGDSEARTGGAEKDAILGDVAEAVIGAIYCDGGLGKAYEFVERLFEEFLADGSANKADAKTTLQEWAQARGLEPPTYTQTERTGPDHAPQFTITVTLGDFEALSAAGPSKKIAEHKAAEAFLIRQQVWKDDQ